MPACDQRTAPPLPGPPKKAEPVAGKDADGAANVPALNAPQPSANPAPEESIDFGRVPNEVLEFFRSHDGQATKRIYLFDPIFQPARANDLPKSKASYTHTP